MLRKSFVVAGALVLAGGIALAMQPSGGQPLPPSKPPVPTVQPSVKPGEAQPAITIEQVKPTTYFVSISKRGKAWVKDKPIRDQPGLNDHVDYLSRALADNKIVMAGPFTDETGGLVIWKVKDLGEAKAAVSADPAVKSGLLEAEIHEWVPALASIMDKPVAKPTAEPKPAIAKPVEPKKDGAK